MRRFKLLGFLFVLLSMFGLPALAQTPDEVSHWKLDDAGGPAIDGISGYDLTAEAGLTFGAGGVAGTAVSTNLQGLNRPFTADLATSEFTFSAWYKRNTAGTSRDVLISYRYGPFPYADLRGYYIYSQGNSHVGFASGTGGAPWEGMTSDEGMTVGVWYHVAGTIDGTTNQVKTLFVSQLGGTFDTTPTTLNSNFLPVDAAHNPYGLLIINGEEGGGSPRPADAAGVLDDVQMYNTSLSAADVQLLFENPGLTLSEIPSAFDLNDHFGSNNMAGCIATCEAQAECPAGICALKDPNCAPCIFGTDPTNCDFCNAQAVALGCTNIVGAVANGPPTADAGADQSIRDGDTVNLDGSASFDDNTASAALDYAWIFSSPLPAGSMAALTNADTATPSFVADIAGTYTVQLIVTDGGALVSTADEVMISSDNLAPTADAGSDQLVILGTSVLLDGSGSSDPETDTLTYAWTLTPDQPAGSTATLFGAASGSPDFVPDLEGLYTVTLEVSDFIGAGTPDTVEITATTAEGFAEVQILDTDAIVSALSAGEVTTAGNQNAFTNFLSQAILALQDGDTDKAIDKLEKSIERTDGCALRGQADGNGSGKDWITDCAAQTDIYALLNDALSALTP